MRVITLDSSVIVAYLLEEDTHHNWRLRTVCGAWMPLSYKSPRRAEPNCLPSTSKWHPKQRLSSGRHNARACCKLPHPRLAVTQIGLFATLGFAPGSC
jgi:hypothetical protein